MRVASLSLVSKKPKIERRERKLIRKSDKEKLVGEFSEKFAKAEAAFIADYQGISVEQITVLRDSLRTAGVEFRVLRNTLAKLAIKSTPYEALGEHMNGPMAVALSYTDAAAAAKALTTFAKEHPAFEIKIAAIGEKILSLDEVKQLSDLPSREELLAKLLGGLNNIPGGLVMVLAGVQRKLLYALNAVKSAKEAA